MTHAVLPIAQQIALSLSSETKSWGKKLKVYPYIRIKLHN